MKILTAPLLAGLVVVSGQTLAADPVAAARGQQLFQYWCATCHAPEPREDGMLLPGTETLQNRYKGTVPAALEQRAQLPPSMVELVIRRGIGAMPQFRKTEISDQDMHEIAAYLDHQSGGAGQATGHNFLEPYFGNTFISRHSDGVEYRVLYSADGTFKLSRSGGPDPSADFEMSGTYTIEGAQVCFHADHPPPQAFSCVPQDQGRKVGETWDVLTPDGSHATHKIIPGLFLHGPKVN
jgi:mono/diheme cytochrome c family protein